jgi:Flp pilus assembly protein TadG
LRQDDRGVAAIEFASAAALLVIIFSNSIDFNN